MSHPARGLPPATPLSPHAPAAARLREDPAAVSLRAVEAALARDSGLRARYPEPMSRLLVRDGERHVEQLARALETGEDALAVEYASWIVPVMRRRGIPMKDLGTLFLGLGDAARPIVGPETAVETDRLVAAMVAALDRPRHLPGDRPRNRLASLVWKASGIAGW
jgi:hypothetical protein